jgi:hypothetical protein
VEAALATIGHFASAEQLIAAKAAPTDVIVLGFAEFMKHQDKIGRRT